MKAYGKDNHLQYTMLVPDTMYYISSLPSEVLPGSYTKGVLHQLQIITTNYVRGEYKVPFSAGGTLNVESALARMVAWYIHGHLF